MKRLGRVMPWWRRFKRNGYKRDRCAQCGHPFRWSRDSRFATGNRDGLVFHGPCQAYQVWRTKAEERLAIVGVACDLAGLTDRDVKAAVELRANSDDERVAASNRAFRVFHDLSKTPPDATPDPVGETSESATEERG